jgi:hypothetical protein
MAIVKTALNRLMTDDRILNHPILSWSLHDLPHNNVRMLKKAAHQGRSERSGEAYASVR